MASTGKVFISHSSKDKPFVRRLVGDLKAGSIPIWFDELELKVGDSLRQTIERGIQESSWLLIVLSHNSVASPWIQQELNAAFALELSRQNVFILPAIIDDCEIPLFLRDKVYADFRRSYDQGFRALLDRFGHDSSSRGDLVYASTEDDNLYREWTLYNTAGVSSASIMQFVGDDGKKGFYLRSFGRENVGLCLSVRSLFGVATFYYKVISGDPSRKNILFAMIPMQETGFARSGYIEVGSDSQDSPQNATSCHRQRYFVPSEHYSSAQWHRGTLEFDFRDTPAAFYSIFAPRINEGCLTPGPAEFQLGEVALYSRE
ncbi:MAG: toll/interleukin-1 receptor domain-containing protein [Planctomycetaceae bacterium]|nr:toll/interleukin-1 receptor domain-containing protein [Planctomycetaceae bacterium]